MAPRTIAQVDCFSQAFQPTRSVIQGLRNGTRFARCMTYFILDRMSQSRPSVDMRLWMDDLSQFVAGPRKVIRGKLVKVLEETCQWLDKYGLKVAPKSVILCSKFPDAKHIAARLRVRGITVVPVLQTAYLGVDSGGGRRHARATAHARIIKAGVMNAKIAKFARAARRYKPSIRLECKGAQPAGHYGHQNPLSFRGQHVAYAEEDGLSCMCCSTRPLPHNSVGHQMSKTRPWSTCKRGVLEVLAHQLGQHAEHSWRSQSRVDTHG